MTWFLLVLLGVLGGLISGLFGVGGAIVIVPGLVLIAGLSQHHAHGTSLAALAIPIGIIVGALNYYKRGQVHIGYAVVIALGMIVGAYFGSKLAGQLPDLMLRKAFGGFVLLVSLKLLFF